ncbi:cadherin-like beta sandwich domain-containing protein [Neobacillus muris]|uniref:cadherin-like beta sandwich domain-containing protein n=1 Tax=Neobacillus muris TaxID=2941334 RepID=UPI00203D6E5B|nr:cadherin-like beta sandwich domain-containing protein [Neobacillus muris]
MKKSLHLFLILSMILATLPILPGTNSAKAEAPSINFSNEIQVISANMGSRKTVAIGRDSNGALNIAGQASPNYQVGSLRNIGGNASYTAQTQLPKETSEFYGTTFADLDNDGYQDLITAGPNGAPASPNNIYRWNAGTNQYDRLGSANDLFNKAFYGIGALAGDFTNDGKQDILWIGTSSVFVGVNNSTPGTIQFSGLKETGPLFSSGFNNTNNAIGDFNHDGNLDFITSNNKIGGLYNIGYGKGDGTFSLETAPLNSDLFQGAAITVADFNNDQKDDFLLVRNDWANGKGELWLFLRNSSNTGFDKTKIKEVDYVYNQEVKAADLNSDGLTDFVITSEVGGRNIDIHLNQGGGSFHTAPDYTKSSPNGINQLFLTDINQDGRTDILAYYTTGFKYYLQDDLPTASPVLNGPAIVGGTLSAASGYFDANQDAEDGTQYAFYRYDRDGISHETLIQPLSSSNTYTVKPSDIGSVIRAYVVPKNKNGTGQAAFSNATSVVPSNNANLANLTLSSGTLSQPFSPNQTVYSASVSHEVDSLEVTAALADPNATLTINGASATAGAPSYPIQLAVGQNNITVVVTAQDGNTKMYSIFVYRMLSNNADLADLSVSPGTLNPAFRPTITNYSMKVKNDVTNIDLTAVLADTNGTLTLNGAPLTSSQAKKVSLEIGANPFTIVTLAEDRTTQKFYSVVVSRNRIPALTNQAFQVDENAAADTLAGTIIGNDSDGDSLSYSITAGNDEGIFMLNRENGQLSVVKGQQLDYETKKSYQLTIAANDGYDTNTATITVHLNNLNDNVPVGTGFTAAIDENTANETKIGKVSSVDRDEDSTVSFHITGGNEANAFAIDENTGEIRVVDETKLDYEKTRSFTLTVEVSDGANQAYSTVTIYLNNVNDHAPVGEDISAILAENAAVNTVVGVMGATDVDGDAITYEITAGNDGEVFKIDRNNGTITVNKSAIMNTKTKPSYQLTIQASDGKFTELLTASIQLLSNDAALSDLKMSEGTMTPLFDPETFDYHVSVGSNTDSIKLAPFVNEENATVTVNGELVQSGKDSSDIRLNEENTNITVTVTAQTGSTQTYTITVKRLKPVVTTTPQIEGQTATIPDDQVQSLDENGQLIIDVKDSATDVNEVQLTKEQLELLKERNASLTIVKNDVQLTIPLVNFDKNGSLLITLEKVDKDPIALPAANLSAHSIYDFTIKLDGKIISTFDHKIEITFPIAESAYEHPEELKVYYWNETNKQWELVGGEYKDGKLTVYTSHFSTFAVFHPDQLAADESLNQEAAKENDKGDSDQKTPGQLPHTATNQYNWLFIGAFLFIAGLVLFYRRRWNRASEK